MVCLFLLAWKMCVAVRADVFLVTLELPLLHCSLWATHSSFIRGMVAWRETSSSQKVSSALLHKHLEGSIPFIPPL